jgi:uncharacterized protein YceK
MIKKLTLNTVTTCSLLLTGCGSFTTLTKDDADIASALRQKNTQCSSLLRIYSGVNFDGCVLNSKPDSSTTNDTVLYYWLFDMVGAAVADTVALPYTIYRQAREGSLNL